MSVIERILKSASQTSRRIALVEGEDPRVVRAAFELSQRKIARPILLGQADKIRETAKQEKLELDGIGLIDPSTAELLPKFADLMYEKRKAKGLTKEQALDLLKDPLWYGAWLLETGEVDGFVGGAVNSTANVFRAGLQVIGMAPGIKTASSCFLVVVPNCDLGADGAFIYADCGLIPFPDANQLADIALASNQMAQALLQTTPYLALLSFSTMGSASHPELEKIKEALKLIRERAPEILVDGELQADAALIPSIGQSKSPGSQTAGKANVLIFPDLNSGNIAYKLTERLAKAVAIGPLPQGFAKPFSDLSRGCNSEDIVIASAIVGLQSTGGVDSSPTNETEIVEMVSEIVARRIKEMLAGQG